MFLSVAALILTGVQLSGADVDVRLRSYGASIALRYDFVDPPGEVILRAIELPGRDLTVVESSEVLRPGAEGTGLEWHVVLGGSTLLIQYEVTGEIDRLPLILPNMATVPGVSTVRMRVSGNTVGLSLVDAFPRMSLAAGGVLEANPTNMPSVIILPRDRRLSLSRLFDGATLLLLGLASIYWFGRRQVGNS